MAEVIRFPIEYRESERLDGSTRQQCLLALRFVLNSIRRGEVTPTEMFIMYGTRNERATAAAREDGRLRPGASAQRRKGDARLGVNDAETIWSYLNLGFDSDGLIEAVCRVLDDVEERKGDARLGAEQDDDADADW